MLKNALCRKTNKKEQTEACSFSYSTLFIMALYAVLRIGSDLFIDVLAVVVFNKGVVYFFDELHVRIGHVCQKQQTEKSEENYQNNPVPSHFYFLLNYQLRLSS